MYRKLFLVAFLLCALLVLVLDYNLTHFSTPGSNGRVISDLIGAAIFALCITSFFRYLLARRIGRLEAIAKNPENTPEIGFTAGVHENDELGRLSNSLESTARRWQKLLAGLRVESAQRESILASMVEGVLAVDANLRVIFCNKSFLKAVGASPSLPSGAPLLETVREPGLVDMLNRTLATGQPAKQRLDFPAHEGRSFQLQIAPLAAPSGARGAIAIFHDITDLERLERVRRDFVANVSHELRTPLTAIRGYAETLLDGGIEDQENNRRFVEIIKAHATRLSNIASDLLTLSELESKHPAAEERIDVSAAIEAAMKIVEPEARLRGIKLICGSLEPSEIIAEKGRLEQALVNLLDNAVKFNRPGGSATAGVHHNPRGEVEIVIADTGIGIPSTDLARIFERFYRVDKTRSREVGGTGLGLSIVKHVIEKINGAIQVESELGKGSKFTIKLPSARIPSSV